MVTICPKCGSVDNYPDLSGDMIAWGGSTQYICNSCGHSGVIFPGVPESEVQEVVKDMKEVPLTTEDVVKGPGKMGSKILLGAEVFGLVFFGAVGLLSGDAVFAITGFGFLLLC